MRFSCEPALPEGLSMDAETGVISGVCAKECDQTVTVVAVNRLGIAKKHLRLLIRPDGILQTPLMGFTSWNAFGEDVCQADIERTADAAVHLGLDRFGYQYINIDSGWQGHIDGRTRAIAPNAKFPNMPGLVKRIHALGLKAGIYSTPMQKAWGGPDLPGCTTGKLDIRYGNTYYGIGSEHCEAENAHQWAEWGLDYLKYDWSPCDPENADLMKKALLSTGRDFGFCVTVNAGWQDAAYWREHCSSWRDNVDSKADWANIRDNRFSTDRWAVYCTPGHFFDLDMLETGIQSSGPAKGSLTEDEQLLAFTIRAIFPSPLQISCDLERLTPFDLALLCNEEVIAVNQDALGAGAVCTEENKRHDRNRSLQSWTKVYEKPLEDGSRAVALFNLGEQLETMAVDASGERARDCWAQEDMLRDGMLRLSLAPHSARMLRLFPCG